MLVSEPANKKGQPFAAGPLITYLQERTT